jgi:hypothetical protein
MSDKLSQEQIDEFQWNENKHDGVGNRHEDFNTICNLARIGLAALDAEPVGKMSDKLRAAAKAALEWLETSKKQSIKEYMQVVDALRAALAEPTVKESLTVAEQEPAAFVNLESLKDISRNPDTIGASRYKTTFRNYPLYATPPRREWVGLTGDEIEDLPKDKMWWEIIRAAEEILKEKNGG